MSGLADIHQRNIPVRRRHFPPLGPDPLAPRGEPLATSKDNTRQLLIFLASSEAEKLRMIDYIIFQKGQICLVIRFQKGLLLNQSIKTVLHCGSHQVKPWKTNLCEELVMMLHKHTAGCLLIDCSNERKALKGIWVVSFLCQDVKRSSCHTHTTLFVCFSN